MKTLTEFWETSISAKWTPIIIEGKPIKDRFLRKELTVRLDCLFHPYSQYNSNKELTLSMLQLLGFRHAITGDHASKTSQALKELGIEVSQKDLFNASHKVFFEDVNDWEKAWGKDPYSGEGSIFCTNLAGEACFFNLKTGKIKPTLKTVGTWLGSLAAFKDEIDWFVKEFPELDLTITFTDDIEEIGNFIPIASLHLFEGKYEVVPTKKYKKIYRLPTYSGIHWKRVWKDFLFKFIRLGRNIQALLDEDGYLYWRNYMLIEGLYNYRSLISNKEVIALTNYWEDECRRRSQEVNI